MNTGKRVINMGRTQTFDGGPPQYNQVLGATTPQNPPGMPQRRYTEQPGQRAPGRPDSAMNAAGRMGGFDGPIHSSGSLDHPGKRGGLARGQMHVDSAASLRIEASRSKQEWDKLTANEQLEESVHDPKRQPMHIDGLTIFLREEYQRKTGVYINKSDNENKKLKDFWKENVSEVFLRLKAEKLAAKQAGGHGDMMSPHADIRQGQRRSQYQHGGSRYGKENEEMNQSGVFAKYAEFGRAFETDVYTTIEKDLDQERHDEVIREMQRFKKRDTQMKEQSEGIDIHKMRKIMQFYVFRPSHTTAWERQFIQYHGLKLAPLPNKDDFTVVSYPKDKENKQTKPSQWKKREDGSWSEIEDKDKKNKHAAPPPLQGVQVGAKPREDTCWIEYWRAIGEYYKVVRDDIRLNDRILREDLHKSDISPQMVQRIDELANERSHQIFKTADNHNSFKGDKKKEPIPEELAGNKYFAMAFNMLLELNLRRIFIDFDKYHETFQRCYSQRDNSCFEEAFKFFATMKQGSTGKISATDEACRRADFGRFPPGFFTLEGWFDRLLLHKVFIARSIKTPLSQHYMGLHLTERGPYLVDCPQKKTSKEITKLLQDYESYQRNIWQYLRSHYSEKLRNEQARRDSKVTGAVLKQAKETRKQIEKTGEIKRNTERKGIMATRAFGLLDGYDYAGGIELDRKRARSSSGEDDDKLSDKDKAEKALVRREKRIGELAKPKDKWKVGRELLKLQKEFPHDRVLQRMIKEEFKTNQPFRAPEEYDVFSHAKEDPMKYYDHTQMKGNKQLDHDLAQTENMIERFNQKDGGRKGDVNTQNHYARAINTRLEAEMIKHAQLYLEDVAKRVSGPDEAERDPNYEEERKVQLGQGQRMTVRQSLLTIWEDLSSSHDRQHLEALQMRFPIYKEPGATKSHMPFPDSFKRYFFRLVKCISDAKKGKKLKPHQVRKRMRQLPTMFMVAGNGVTHNKRVALTRAINSKIDKHVDGLRTRVFHRKDPAIKEALSQVFMTADDQDNCHFEPKIGTLNSHYKLKGGENDNVSATYYKKFGVNFKDDGDTRYLWKLGILKQCKVNISRGNYEKAWNDIMTHFNVESLRQIDAATGKKVSENMDELKKMVRRKIAQRFSYNRKKREEESTTNLHDKFKKDDSVKRFTFAEMQNMGLYQKGKNRAEKWWAENAGLVYQPPDSQLVMDGEDISADTVVGRINREVYDLVKLIERNRDDKIRNVKRLDKRKEELKQLRESGEIDKNARDNLDSVGVLFKTLMCPLKDRCSKVQKIRWPYSKIKSIARFGANCPYGHHPMELSFKEAMDSRINATEAAKKTQIFAAKHQNVKGARSVFYPAGSLFNKKPYDYEAEYKTTMDRKKKEEEKKQNKISRLGMQGEQDEMLENDIKLREIKEKMETNHLLMEGEFSSERASLNTAKMYGDENFCKKFGHLKKGCVLMFYQRYNDAFDELANAVKIIRQQKELEKEKIELIKTRWCFKLDLDDIPEIPFPIDKVHPDDITDKELEKKSDGVPVQKLRLFWEKISPFKLAEGSRDTFLNMQVEEAYLKCEAIMANKFEEIKVMKKAVQKFEEFAEQMDEFGSDEEEEEEDFDDDDPEGKRLRRKKRPSKMCPQFMKNGKCKERTEFNKAKHNIKRHDATSAKVPSDCPYGHNPLELDIIPKETTNPDPANIHDKRDVIIKSMVRASSSAQVNWNFPSAKNTYDQMSKNLKGIVKKQSHLLKKPKSAKPFVPPSYGGIEDPAMFAPYEYHEPYNEEDAKEEDNKVKFYEREYPARKPFEEAD